MQGDERGGCGYGLGLGGAGQGWAGAEAQERCNLGPFTDPVHSSMYVSRRTHRRRSRHGPGQTLTNRWVLQEKKIKRWSQRQNSEKSDTMIV